MPPVLARLLAAYPDDLRLVFKHMPVTAEDSGRAAIAAEAAHRQGRFWAMHDLLFELQGRPLHEPELLRRAAALGLDAERLAADLRSEAVVERVRADLAEAERLKIAGTPAFFVNGRYRSGAQSYASLSRLIDEELAGVP
jgi:protein-disulfide isomerase